MKKLLPVISFILAFYSGYSQQQGLGLSFMPYQEAINNINCQKGLCGTSPLVFYQQIAVVHDHFGKNTLAWWPADSTHNYFNEHQRDSLNVTYVYSRTLGQWVYKRRLIYTYDNNGMESASTIQVWDSANNAWKNFDQVQYIHNADGLLATYVFLSWDSITSEWLPLQETTEAYNKRGNVIGNVTERWDTLVKKWMNLSKVLNHYDKQGKNDTSTEYSWNDKWINFQQYIYSYDIAGNETQAIKQLWENTSKGTGWVNYSKDEYTYNEASSPVSQTTWHWDDVAKIFKPIARNEHTYDFYNNDTLYQTFIPDTANSGWMLHTTTSKIYDNSNNKEYEDVRGYDASTESYYPMDQYHYYYNSFTGGGTFATPDSISGITLSPNISNGSHEMVLTVNLDQQAQLVVSVYDMAGTLLQTIQENGSMGTNEFFLQLNSLTTGMYEIQVANTLTKAATVVKLMVP